MLIIGYGALGRRVAALSLAHGGAPWGLVRRPEAMADLGGQGIPMILADLDQGLPPPLPSRAGTVLYLVPPPEAGQEDPRLGRVLEAFHRDGQPRRLVYISTSGVYGDCGGAWIDETQPTAATADRSLRRLAAERQVRDWAVASGGEWVILRVAGIYGPGYLPLSRLRQGLPIVGAGEAPFTNRIHVDDLARICLAALERPLTGEIINVCDGQPSTMADYFDRVADLAGLPRAPKISLAEAAERLSPGMLSYLRESRRIRNDKLRELLGVELLYPDLELGLRASFAELAS